VAERQFGPYKLIRQIAVGGMAEIHLAKTAGIAGFEKYVALKMIHPNFAEDDQFIQMLVDEAKIAVQLTHGNIAQTFDLGRVGETYYITMEYVDGADLYKILRRASEQDLEMPLDVCAFVGKEISSALDHAHRKRDHTGKSLGIVHRDVSPQNVLLSYSGEVKLVDFGIAKATMKARQTAVGVIKGKYYYMSPEQAWGDPIDYRSDIFSAGIVLYEMITGQMLYLEEDLHKLLEMARSADIAPPSKLRRGVPPQLERIVMHALAKVPGERYQSASDFATDLERFLHAYSPVFTASKLSTLLRQVIGDPMQVPDDVPFESIEFRDGVMSTHPLDDAEVAHAVDRNELRDENSVIFRMNELAKAKRPAGAAARPDGRSDAETAAPQPGAMRPSAQPGAMRPSAQPGAMRPSAQPEAMQPRPGSPRPSPPQPSVVQPRPATPQPSVVQPRPATPPPSAMQPRPGTPMPRPSTPPPLPGAARPGVPSKPMKQVAPRVTRATDPMPVPVLSPARPTSTSRIPSIVAPRPSTTSKIPQIVKPRQPHEETRQLEQLAPANPLHDDSGLLTTDGQKLWSDGDRELSDDDFDNIGERTLITAAPGPFGPMATPGTQNGAAAQHGQHGATGQNGALPPDGLPGPLALSGFMDGDDHVEATLVTAMPTGGFASEDDPTVERNDDDGPTVERQLDHPTKPARAKSKAPPPAALAARIHAPAVSELRKPRASRRTPPGGAPVASPNILQAIMSSQASEPMPAPRPAPALAPALPPPPTLASQQPTMIPTMGPTMLPHGPHAPADPYAAQQLFPVGTPGGQVLYSNDASGLPLGIPTPPGLSPQVPGVPDHLQPYLHMQGMPPGAAGYGAAYDPQPLPTQMSPQGYPQLSPQALYQFQPSQQPMSITGQMRLFEVDELPSQYKLGAARRRWLTYIVSGILAVSLAAGVTFLIIRSLRDTAPTVGSVHIESVPPNADVRFDGTLLNEKTPLTIDKVQVGTPHQIRVEFTRHQPYEETISVPRNGGEISVTAALKPITGKLLVNTVPPNAEIHINGQLRGRTPTTLSGIDMDSAKRLELRLKDYQPYVQELSWPPEGKIQIDVKLVR
jgi:serine/threonine protein kinase